MESDMKGFTRQFTIAGTLLLVSTILRNLAKEILKEKEGEKHES